MASTDTAGTSAAEGTGTEAHDDGVRRRDFLSIAAVSAGGVGVLGAIYPLVSQMAPSADVLAESTTEVDIASLEPGQTVKATFRKQPVFISHLTPQEIEQVQSVDVSDLRDPQTIADRTLPGHQEILVMIGVCTHLGCIPLGADAGENKGEFGGYFCPCHGSHYDPLGRTRKGPAPANLPVPEYEFTTDTTIVIG